MNDEPKPNIVDIILDIPTETQSVEQLKKSNHLETEIKKNLKGLGYEI